MDIQNYKALAEQGKLNGILCKYEGIPEWLVELVGEVSKIHRVQFDLDEGYICPIGELGHWVPFNQMILILP